jgi:hypothetical protein
MKKVFGLLLCLGMTQAMAQFGPGNYYSGDMDFTYNTQQLPGAGPQCLQRIRIAHNVIDSLRNRFTNSQAQLANCEAKLNKPNPLPFPFPTLNNKELQECRVENQRLSREIYNLNAQSAEQQTRISQLQTQNDELHEMNLYFQNENLKLTEQLQDLLGNNPNLWVCASACSKPDKKTTSRKSVQLGYGQFQSEANVESIKNVIAKETCHWGLVSLGCELVTSSVEGVYCSASCTEPDLSTANLKTSHGAKGRSRVEAEALALQAVVKQETCHWDVKVNSCESLR